MVFVRAVIVSPLFFAVYLDGLLTELSNSGVGCYWGCLFVGAVVNAYDVILLGPCASAMRTMLETVVRMLSRPN